MLSLIRGLPGSGKSTFAKKLNKLTGAIHLEADMYFMKNGVYEFDKEKISLAHRWCLDTARIFLNQGYNVVVSNTFTQKWEMENYITVASEAGSPTEIYRCTQNYGSLHNVPEETLKKMQARFEDIENEQKVI